jgi:hypothetical protein
MATKRRLNRPEQKFWREAFLGAEISTLLRSNGRQISPIGAAHLAAEYADAALTEFKARYGTKPTPRR